MSKKQRAAAAVLLAAGDEFGPYLSEAMKNDEFASAYAAARGTSNVEWAVLDGDVLETWPSRDAAVAELNDFYSDDARLVCRTVTDWVDAGGRG